MRTVFFTLMILTLLGLAACDDDDGTVLDPADSLADLQIETTLLTPEVVRGDDMQARLTLRNNTQEPISLYFRDTHQTHCEVIDAVGNIMEPDRSYAQVPTVIDIPAQGSVERTASFGTQAGEIDGYPYGVDLLPAGQYQFRPYLLGLDNLAETLTVTVVER